MKYEDWKKKIITLYPDKGAPIFSSINKELINTNDIEYYEWWQEGLDPVWISELVAEIERAV